MRKIPVDSIQPGMVVAKAVYSSDGLILINRGQEFRDSFKQYLKSYGILSVYIEDGLLLDVEVEDVISEQTRVRANQVLKEALDGLEKQARQGKKLILDEPKISGMVNRIIAELISNGDVVVNLTDIRTVDDYTFGHSVNVSVLAILTGINLGYSQSELALLGTGAVLHDVGKVKVPASILKKPGSLSSPEFEEIKKHADYGYEMLSNQKYITNVCALMARQHHEKYDGSGYPRGLKGDRIHEFSRITALVDVYDALTADRPYRKAYQPYEAFEMIAGAGNLLFDYRLVKTFLDSIALYPVGTLVQLSSGETGVVTGTPKGMAPRPTLQILYDSYGNRLSNPYEVKLSEDPHRLILRTLGEEEWLKIYGEHSTKHESVV